MTEQHVKRQECLLFSIITCFQRQAHNWTEHIGMILQSSETISRKYNACVQKYNFTVQTLYLQKKEMETRQISSLHRHMALKTETATVYPKIVLEKNMRELIFMLCMCYSHATMMRIVWNCSPKKLSWRFNWFVFGERLHEVNQFYCYKRQCTVSQFR